VTLTAVPSAGYVFDSWSGQTEGIADLHQNPVTFLMGDRNDNDRVMTANFVPSDLQYIVTVTCEPGSGGSVRLSPEQPPVGYPVSQNVSVVAVPGDGYVFSRWVGDLAGGENPRTILVGEDKSFTAVFNASVTVYCIPSEGGSYVVAPASSSGYAAGTEVTITAKPAKGYRFVAWEGDLLGSAKSITITVDEAKTTTARFAEQSTSRWWLWVILGLGGLLGALVLIRLLYARMNSGYPDEPYQPDE